MSGANRFTTILRVSLPLIWPAVLAGLIYNIMTAMALYEVAALMLDEDVPVLSTELFFYVRSAGGSIELGYAAVYGVLMMAFALFALWYYGRTMSRANRYAVITGKGYRPKLTELGRWRWAALGFVGLFFALSELFPLLMLIWMSVMPALSIPSIEALSQFNLVQYGQIWGLIGGWETFFNTVILVIVTPICVVGLSLTMSLVTIRSKLPGKQWIDHAAMLPHVIPGLSFAFALFIVGILFSKYLSIDISGTLTIIIIALIVYRIPYCTRVTNAALIQIHTEIEESAQLCGSRKFYIVAKIIVPLIKSSLSYALVWIALLVLREVTIPLLLSSPSNTVLSVRIWTLWETGQYSEASAIGVAMFVISAILLLTVQRLFRSTGLFEIEDK